MVSQIASVLLIGVLSMIGCAQQPAPPTPAPLPVQGVYVPGFGMETLPAPPAVTRNQTAPPSASSP